MWIFTKSSDMAPMKPGESSHSPQIQRHNYGYLLVRTLKKQNVDTFKLLFTTYKSSHSYSSFSKSRGKHVVTPQASSVCRAALTL